MTEKLFAKNLTFSKPLYAILDGESVNFLCRLGVFLLENPNLPVCAIQMRGKRLNAKDFAYLCKTLVEKRLMLQHAPPLIVNDCIEIAQEFGIGLHIGQNDCSLDKARMMLGNSVLIGVSTHDLQQAKEAQEAGANYIGFGPLFDTSSKTNALEPRAPEALLKVLQTIAIPVVGIGGITLKRWPQLKESGLRHFAMIQGLNELGCNESLYRDIARDIF